MEVSISTDEWTKMLVISSTATSIESGKIFSDTSPFVLSDTNCVRVAGTLSTEGSNNDAEIVFNFADPTQTYENVHLSLSSTRASSSSDNVEFAAKDLVGDVSEPVDFLIVVGAGSAVLIVDGKVVSATRLGEQAQLSVALKSGRPSLSNLRIDPSPKLDGCANS